MFSAAGKKVYSIYFYSILTSTVATRPESERGHRIIFVSPITHVTAFRLPHDPSSRVQSVFCFFSRVFFFVFFFRTDALFSGNTSRSVLQYTIFHGSPAVFGSPSEHYSPFTLYEYGVHNMMSGPRIVNSRNYSGQVPVMKCYNIPCTHAVNYVCCIVTRRYLTTQYQYI